MGAGKTTVGRRCAQRLGRPFVDTDDLVVAMTGMPFAEFFAEYGEPAFRDLERQAVADVGASPEPLVIACGGGTVIDPENRSRLRATGTVVWLQAPVPVLANRVGAGRAGRSSPVTRSVRSTRLGATREAAYEATAHGHVDTGGARRGRGGRRGAGSLPRSRRMTERVPRRPRRPRATTSSSVLERSTSSRPVLADRRQVAIVTQDGDRASHVGERCVRR